MGRLWLRPRSLQVRLSKQLVWQRSRRPWRPRIVGFSFKTLATQHGIVLVRFNERTVDPLQEVDPWAKYSSKPRHRGPKAADKKSEVVHLTVDYTFFHSKGLEIPPITVDQMFQSFPGVAACSFEDGHGLVAEVLGRSLSTKAQGLLLTGSPPKDFDITKCGNAAVVVVPVLLNQKPAAVQCVLFQTGDLQVEYHAGLSRRQLPVVRLIVLCCFICNVKRSLLTLMVLRRFFGSWVLTLPRTCVRYGLLLSTSAIVNVIRKGPLTCTVS